MNKIIQDELSKQLKLAEGNSKKIRSPLKWAGGQYSILEDIKKKLPKSSRLIEPFLGSGVVFMNTNYDHYTLNDKNNDLITFYKILKKEGEKFIEYCREHFYPTLNNEEKYYEIREKFNASSEDKAQKSALFLYRYNSSGNYNVPFGRYKSTYFPEQEMRLFWKKSKRAAFLSKDFQKVMLSAQEGDVIYCDPPYVPLSNTSNFTSYNAGGFDAEEQKDLASISERISKQGVTVLISNHYTAFTEKIYSEANTHTLLSVRRLISCNGSNRKNAKEILALYLPS